MYACTTWKATQHTIGHIGSRGGAKSHRRPLRSDWGFVIASKGPMTVVVVVVVQLMIALVVEVQVAAAVAAFE